MSEATQSSGKRKTSGPHPVHGFDFDVDNPKPQEVAPPQHATGGTNGDKVVIVMVGMPGTGKTYIARKISRYLSFFQDANTRVFNVGEYRQKLFPGYWTSEHEEDSKQMKEQITAAAISDLKTFMHTKQEKQYGVVCIFDAVNHTRADRADTYNQLKEEGWKVIFLESVIHGEALRCEMEDIHIQNHPDYQDVEHEEARAQFKARVATYSKEYEEMGQAEKGYRYIQLIDGGEQVNIRHIDGYLPGRIVQFVMNLQFRPQTFFFSRHGQSEYNVSKKIGGDSGLSPAGEEYALALADFARNYITRSGDATPVRARLWTSSLKRTRMTARHINLPNVPADEEHLGEWIQMRPRMWRNLDEIYAGVCDGMTYKEIEAAYPAEFAARSADKLGYRYPRGESYLDVLQRLDPIVQEMERSKEPLLVVGHQGIIRILFAYLMGLERKEAPHSSIPLNTVIEMHVHTYGCDEERHVLISKETSMDAPSH